MPVNRIQVGGSDPSPDRPSYNLVAGTGISITAADDSTNNVSKATIAVSGNPSATTVTGTTSVLTPTLDAVSAGALAIGTTTATSISLKQNTSLAAGKSLTLAATGGLVPSVAGFTSFWTAGIGVETATSGTDTACSNGDLYWCATLIPYNCTITGISYLIGSVGGTDKAIVALYDSTGALLASSALAGTTVGTAANWQPLDFTAPYAAVGPALYYVVLQFNGTTAKFRTHAGPGQKFVAATVAGTFGTLASFTPGTSFTASKGPIAVTY